MRYDSKTVKAKKAGVGAPASNAGAAAPTTFFLKSEKEMEKGGHHRGRSESRVSEPAEENTQKTPLASLMGDSSFGVESLEETINSAFSTDSNLSRTDSNNSTESASEAGIDGHGSDLLTGRKRKTGNRVHPTILATGQRIISSERPSSQASSGNSPAPAAVESPFRPTRLRRPSANSSTNMSQPLTPLKLSPQPESAFTSTPRSASLKSFRLSDEDSITDETHSQALLSSNGDDEVQVERTPQLVMPSLAMPTRRPFTERGRQIGRSKIMVLGPKGIGKTSLIQSVCRRSEDIVHVDQPATSISSQQFGSEASEYQPTSTLVEILASTRPFPSWFTGAESVRSLQRRRSSVGEGVLERNITLLDTPGLVDDGMIQRILDTVNLNLRRATTFDPMADSELVEMLGGSGGVQIDAVLYLFDPDMSQSSYPRDFELSHLHQHLIRLLCRYTNFIPVVGRSDTVSTETMTARKQQIAEMLDKLQAEPYNMSEAADSGRDVLPLAISSAVGDDEDEIDASVLMSSQYMQPLVPSELDALVDQLLAPANVARMKHISAVKYMQWRQINCGERLDLQKQTMLQSPFNRSVSPGVTSAGSQLEDPSKVLVPHSQSSYYRSSSPAISDSSLHSGQAAGASEIARYNEQAQPSEPFRRIRLAKWAQDLQRSLDNERRKYRDMYINRPSEWTNEDQAVVSTKDGLRPGRGRLGGDLGVIDPRDPLGVLAFGQAFRRRGVFLLQVVGGFGLIGTVAYWIVKNWVDVQGYFGLSQSHGGMVTATAVPAPVHKTGWFDDASLKNFFGWGGK